MALQKIQVIRKLYVKINFEFDIEIPEDVNNNDLKYIILNYLEENEKEINSTEKTSFVGEVIKLNGEEI